MTPSYKDRNFRFISGAGKLTGITMNIEIRQYLPYYCSDKGLKGNIVNRALSSLHGESLDITYSPVNSLIPAFSVDSRSYNRNI